MLKTTILGPLIRHGLTAIGGALVAQGYVDAASWSEISGGAMALIGLALSFNEKRGAARS